MMEIKTMLSMDDFDGGKGGQGQPGGWIGEPGHGKSSFWVVLITNKVFGTISNRKGKKTRSGCKRCNTEIQNGSWKEVDTSAQSHRPAPPYPLSGRWRSRNFLIVTIFSNIIFISSSNQEVFSIMKFCRWVEAVVAMLVVVVIGLVFYNPVLAEGSKSDKEKLETVRKMSQRFKGKFPDAVEISSSEALALFEKGEVLFVDVRTAKEREVSMLPDAVSRETFEKNSGIADGKTAVAYCTIGVRSASFSQKMNRTGTRVLSLSGGVLAWLLEGGTVYNAGKETKRVHVYGDGWNYLPEGYEAATR